ncbi:hypothetical protein EKQ09_23905 [Escherichia coli]|nr:hypothetical protein [Escherichia coli]EFE7922596.1 hypothetical protein [Escherichia coli]MHU31098.1 hypothetical protein [Escherichia coli]
MCIHLNLMIFTKIIRGFISNKPPSSIKATICDLKQFVFCFFLFEKITLLTANRLVVVIHACIDYDRKLLVDFKPYSPL